MGVWRQEKEAAMKGRLPLGPLMASSRQPFQLECEVEGGVVTSARLTSAAERLSYAPGFEGASSVEGAELASHFCARSAVHLGWAFSLAVEDALGMEVNDEHDAMRVALSEWARIASHLEAVSDVARTLEDDLVYVRPRRYVHRIHSAFEEACGNAFGFGVVVPGGVALSSPAAAVEMLDALSRDADMIERDVGFWSRKVSLSHARLRRGRLDASWLDGEASAASLRASGSGLDLRTGEAYGPYGQLAYRTVKRDGGTALDRTLVLLAEIKASVGLIKKVREAASGCEGAPGPVSPRKGTGAGAVESPHGAVDCRVFIDSEGKIIRARLNGDAELVAGLAGRAMEGVPFEDAAASLASLNLCGCCTGLGGRERGSESGEE